MCCTVVNTTLFLDAEEKKDTQVRAKSIVIK